MSIARDEFIRIADAERQLCEEAGPTICDVIRDVMARTGLRITDFRVTLDSNGVKDATVSANCTIVHAHFVPAADAGTRITGSSASPRSLNGKSESPR